MNAAFFPETLFSEELTETLTSQSTSIKQLMTRVSKIPSVGSVVARKEQNGTFALKVAVRQSKSHFDLFGASKNRYSLKWSFATFSNAIEFDKSSLFVKVSPFGFNYGCRNSFAYKYGASHQFPLSLPTDFVKLFAWSGFHETFERTRLGLKVSYPLRNFSAYLFRESKTGYQEEGKPKPKSLIGFKAKLKYDLSELFRSRSINSKRAHLKFVFPILGISDDDEWHLRLFQTAKLPTNWLFRDSVLDIETAVNLSNKYNHCLYQMRGVDGQAKVTEDESDKFNVQSFVNLKLKGDQKGVSQNSSFKPFWFMSVFMRDLIPAKLAAGLGIELISSEELEVELLFNCLDMHLRVRATSFD